MSLLELCGTLIVVLVIVGIIALAAAISFSMPDGEQDGSNPFDEDEYE